ncbi:hypothetical protein Gasu2_63030 [Galdieria sulphuraria]|nr:hypothetical protein Gasu2_63030 [Galdieria sulphuraria]
MEERLMSAALSFIELFGIDSVWRSFYPWQAYEKDLKVILKDRERKKFGPPSEKHTFLIRIVVRVVLRKALFIPLSCSFPIPNIF